MQTQERDPCYQDNLAFRDRDLELDEARDHVSHVSPERECYLPAPDTESGSWSCDGSYPSSEVEFFRHLCTLNCSDCSPLHVNMDNYGCQSLSTILGGAAAAWLPDTLHHDAGAGGRGGRVPAPAAHPPRPGSAPRLQELQPPPDHAGGGRAAELRVLGVQRPAPGQEAPRPGPGGGGPSFEIVTVMIAQYSMS